MFDTMDSNWIRREEGEEAEGEEDEERGGKKSAEASKPRVASAGIAKRN